MSPTAVVLVGHGSREATAVAQFEALAVAARARAPAGLRVVHGYVELVEPGMDAALDAAVAALAGDATGACTADDGPASEAAPGARGRVALVPCVLSAAGHVRVDVRAAIQRARERHGAVEFHQAPHLGAHPAVVEVLVDRARAALEGCDVREAGVVFASRGSSHTSALAEGVAIAAQVAARIGARACEVGYFAVAAPDVREACARCVRAGARVLVLVPHLMADGRLSREAREQLVPRAREEHLGVTIVAAEVLGADARLVDAALALGLGALGSERRRPGCAPADAMARGAR